jgi:hypothetical protein
MKKKLLLPLKDDKMIAVLILMLVELGTLFLLLATLVVLCRAFFTFMSISLDVLNEVTEEFISKASPIEKIVLNVKWKNDSKTQSSLLKKMREFHTRDKSIWEWRSKINKKKSELEF